VRVTLLPSSFSGDRAAEGQYLTSLLINDTVAVDAGSLGFFGTPQEQARVKHVLITHTHVDHIASLPIFVENVFEGKKDCVTIHGSDAVLDCLRRDVFNDRVWPDFVRLSSPNAPFLKLERMEAGRPLLLDGLKFTPVAVEHVVPTLGLIIEEPGTTVVIASDTGPTEEIWRQCNSLANLKAVFLEAAFPDDMKWLAEASKHLTPAMFRAEVGKVRARGVRWLAVHIKARWIEQISAELRALGMPGLEICRAGHPYEF
jgi:ribonuclease BN (tRNA processing enzyme)